MKDLVELLLSGNVDQYVKELCDFAINNTLCR